VCLLVSHALCPTSSPAMGSSADSGRVRATFAVDWPSRSASVPTEPSDLLVVWNNEPQTILAIEPLASAATGGSSTRPWQVVVYFDAPLLSAEGFRRATDLLSRHAEGLVGLGSVSVVLADSTPQEYSASTTEVLQLRQAFKDLADESVALGELIWLRQRYQAHGDDDRSELETAEAVRRETELLQGQRIGLLQWLDQTAANSPKLLLLVQAGFDLNPRSFYLSQTGRSFLEDPRLQPLHDDIACTLAAEGWVVVPVSLGSKQEVFSDPLAPLSDLADTTGGALIRTRRQLGPTLEQLSNRYWVTVDLNGSDEIDGGVLEVRDVAADRRLTAPAWMSAGPTPTRQALRSQKPSQVSDEATGSVAGRKVIELLEPPELTVSGQTRFHAIASHRRIGRVEFWLDEALAGSDRRVPYSSVIDLGSEPAPHTIRVVAFDASGNELGEDSVEINKLQAPPQIFISSLTNNVSEQVLEIRTKVHSDFAEPTRLDFYLNDSLSSSLSAPPYDARIPYKTLSPQHFVRVIAHYPDGRIAETVQMAITSLSIDRLDVNTIEILATVTSKQRTVLPRLDQNDFVVHTVGGPVPIDHFSRSDHLPLAMGLLLDTSDSMDKVIESVGEAAEKFFEQALGPEDVAFVVDFDTRPRLARSSTGDTEDLMRSIRSLEARGNTALYDSIAFSLQQFDDKVRRKALVVVTDGLDSTSQLLPRRCIQQARHYGVPVYLIVMGAHSRADERRQVAFTAAIARQTGGRTFYLSDLDDLDEVYSQISAELRSQYLFAVTTDRALTPKELEKITVEVLRKDLNVRAILASQQQGSQFDQDQDL
jgi:Ca-activated chloride channel family protein